MDRQDQSKLGIASLLISIFTAIGLFIVFLIAGVLESNTYGGIDEESAGAEEAAVEKTEEEIAAEEEQKAELEKTENPENVQAYSDTVEQLMDKFVDTEIADSADQAEQMAGDAVMQLPTKEEMEKAAADAMAKRVGVAESVLDRWSKLAGLED